MTTGYYFTLKGLGAALSCVFMNQATVAPSSTEADYERIPAEVQEALNWKQFLEEFCIQEMHPRAIVW